jgi:beta-glucosidase
MKKTCFTILLCFAWGLTSYAQTNQSTLTLREDNIEEILKAMTNKEKVSLLVGGPGSLVPGAAGYTREIERLGIPMTVLADGPAGLRIQPKREGTDHPLYHRGPPPSTPRPRT